jgi:hypothetical protein
MRRHDRKPTNMTDGGKRIQLRSHHLKAKQTWWWSLLNYSCFSILNDINSVLIFNVPIPILTSEYRNDTILSGTGTETCCSSTIYASDSSASVCSRSSSGWYFHYIDLGVPLHLKGRVPPRISDPGFYKTVTGELTDPVGNPNDINTFLTTRPIHNVSSNHWWFWWVTFHWYWCLHQSYSWIVKYFVFIVCIMKGPGSKLAVRNESMMSVIQSHPHYF